MSIVNELFADSKPRLENFQNTYFEEFLDVHLYYNV